MVIGNQMRNYLHKYFFLIGKKRKKLISLVGLFLIASMLDLLGIGLIAPFIAVVIAPETLSNYSFWNAFESILGITEIHHSLIVLGMTIIVLFYVKGFAAYWVRISIVKYSLGIQSELTCRLMSAYQRMPYQFHIKRNTASLILATSGHTSNFAHHTLIQSLELFSEVIVVIMILTLLATTNYVVMLSMTILLAFVYFLYDKAIKHRIKNAGKDTATASEGIIKGVKQGVEGLKEIRVYGRELYFYNKVKDSTVDFANVSSRLQGLKIIPRYLFESTIISFVIGLSIISILTNEASTNLFPIIGMFGVASMRLIPSAGRISGAMISIRFSSYAMSELYRDINEAHDINLNSPLINIQPLKTEVSKPKFKKLEINNISYRYPQTDRDVISNLSMCVESHQSIGIIGRSGSGKTTLINILLGLLTPQQGTVEANGVPIKNDLRKWLDIVAYIPQDVFILDDTIRRNIALGVSDERIDVEKLAQSIYVAQLKDVVNKLPNGMETVVGERGVRLSGGERQRLALARSFYHEREVIIMDEATAALDNETEQQLVRAINEFKTDKTMIIIAHRLSTVKDCDIVYKVDNGRIIDSGSLESLGEIQHLL